jgi:hypothetical protein
MIEMIQGFALEIFRIHDHVRREDSSNQNQDSVWWVGEGAAMGALSGEEKQRCMQSELKCNKSLQSS